MIQKPRGTQDIFNAEAKEYTGLEKIILKVLKSYNLQEIRTPIFESKELFVRSAGSSSDVVSKEMYEFLDKKGREFVLRPEGTAPIVRALIENKLYVPVNLPFKVYYLGPMFRYERPQIGRNRQFEQIGVEIFGPHNVYQDLEVLAMVMNIVKALNIENKVQLDLNFLVTGLARKKYIKDLKEYFKTIPNLCEDCQKRIEINPLRVLDCKKDESKFEKAPNMNNYLSTAEKEYFTEILVNLKALGINLNLNNKLVRGLDYYTGLIFELKYLSSNLGSQSTIIAGGRYNELVKSLNGPDLPAIGFALGIERLLIVARENNLDLIENESLDLYTIALTKKAHLLNQKILFSLRSAGFLVDTDYLERNLKSAFKQAEKFQAKNIIVLGDEEVNSNYVKVKNQNTKKETKIKIEELVKFLREKE